MMHNLILRNIFILISGAVFVGTFILNMMAIIYISSKRDKTSISILVVNLAITDMIHAMGIIFFSSNLFTPQWIFGEFGCKFSLTIDVLCTVVIVYTVAALSVERYIDARAKLTAKCRLYITFTSLILIWTLGLLLPYPFVFYTFLYDSRSIVHLNETRTTTETKNQTTIPTVLMCRSILSENTLLIYEIILYITAFLIPYSIIVLFSLKLLRFLRDWLKRKEKLTHRRSSKRRTRGVKLVLCIVLSFLLCYTPFWTFKFYTSFLVDETIRNRPILRRFLTYAHQSVILLSYIEGILNPLFFIVLTERFSLTFSKHRSKHLKFLRSRSDEKRNSISAHLRNSKKRQCSRTTIGTGSTTIEKVDLNGLLLTNHHVLQETDSVPFNVSSSLSKEKNPQ